MVTLDHRPYVITITNDPDHNPDAADHSTRYEKAYTLDGPVYMLSQHGIMVRTPEGLEHTCVVRAGGGMSGVHKHSALVQEQVCVVAVGRYLVALTLPTLDLLWQVEVDTATCFGVYYAPKYNWYISHGECNIAAVTRDGELIWTSGGKDIFTNGFRLYDDTIEVIDFNNERYVIDLATGHSTLVPATERLLKRWLNHLRRRRL